MSVPYGERPEDIVTNFSDSLSKLNAIQKEILQKEGLVVSAFDEIDQFTTTRLEKIRNIREEMKALHRASREMQNALAESVAAAA